MSDLERAAKAAIKVLDNCTHSDCIEDRERTGFSTCAGGHLAKKVAAAIRALPPSDSVSVPTDGQCAAAVRAWFGDADCPPVSQDFINRMRKAMLAAAKEKP